MRWVKRGGNIRAALGTLLGGNRRGQPAHPAPRYQGEAGSLRAFDPLDPEFVANPYPYLEQLQDREPVHRSASGAWVLTRHVDVLGGLLDRRLGNAPSPYAVVNKRNRARFTSADVANNIVPFLDAPDHACPRKLIGRAFAGFLNRSAIDLHGLALSALASLADGGDALHDFATPYAVRVISTLLGVPPEDEPLLKPWSESFFYLFTMIPSVEIRCRLDEDLSHFRAYFRQLVEERRHRPRDDLVSALLGAEVDGKRLSVPELVDHCMLLFADGVENVDSGIANALYTLLGHPEQFALLRARPGLIRQAVEECLRFEAPGQFIGRVVLENFEWHGVRLEKNAPVLLVIGAANRDPRQFDNPHRFDILRTSNDHLGFGRGIHACIGAPLVRLELAAVLGALLEFPREITLAGPAVTWAARPGHRWLAGLQVAVT